MTKFPLLSDETYREHGDDSVAVIGVSLDEDSDRFMAKLEEFELDWPQVFDGKGIDGEIARTFRLTDVMEHTPHLVVVDAEGSFVFVKADWIRSKQAYEPREDLLERAGLLAELLNRCEELQEPWKVTNEPT